MADAWYPRAVLDGVFAEKFAAPLRQKQHMMCNKQESRTSNS